MDRKRLRTSASPSPGSGTSSSSSRTVESSTLPVGRSASTRRRLVSDIITPSVALTGPSSHPVRSGRDKQRKAAAKMSEGITSENLVEAAKALGKEEFSRGDLAAQLGVEKADIKPAF